VTVVYNDTRFNYEDSRLTYDGTIVVTLTGDQPAATGTVASAGSIYARTLTGNQPVAHTAIYDDPDVTYEQLGIDYERAQDPGQLSWNASYARIMSGDQPAATGDLTWAWHPYIWAEYSWTMDETMEELAYTVTVSNDDDVQYLHQEAHDDDRVEAEYTHLPINPYRLN
jgi:hypothetical protein